jgi:hypothetical protein
MSAGIFVRAEDPHMPVWMVAAIWGGLVNMAVVLINWRGRILYERAREASLVAAVQALALGGTVSDERPDGTVLRVEVPGPQVPAWEQHLLCPGDGVAKPR